MALTIANANDIINDVNVLNNGIDQNNLNANMFNDIVRKWTSWGINKIRNLNLR